jgi:hypothetical protein
MNASFLWDVDDPPPAEGRWFLVRRYRNELLTRCDWTQLPDAALAAEEKQAWSDYRQQLRDIPETFLLPDEVIFPSEPGAA